MSSAVSITFDVPLVASPKQAMRAIQVSRKKLYELINTGELESYTEGKSRRITVKSTITSSADWQQKRFGAAEPLPLEMINHVLEHNARFAAARALPIAGRSRWAQLLTSERPDRLRI